MHRRPLFVTLTVAIVLTLAACGSAKKSDSAGGGGAATTSSTAPVVVNKTLGPGATADTLKLGVSLIDFKCIQDFIDFTRPDQQPVYQAFIDDVNEKNGINGRKIVPVFNTECPLSPTSDLLVQVCTKFTDDEKVFAVIGNMGDAAQDAAIHTCIAKQHKTPVITYTITQDMIDQVPPGMMILPGTTPERSSAVLFELLKKAGKLEGLKVAVLAAQTSEPSVKSVVIPAMKKAGVETGTPAYLTISGADTTAAQQQLDSFIERWKSENVNALFITGQNVVAKQFVEKVAKQMPGVTLMTDTGEALYQGQDETKAGANPNPYEGMYFAGGYRAEDYAKSENWKHCADIYKAQTGKTAPSPTADIKVNVGGKELQDQTYNLINDACQMLSTFQQIVAKTGDYPNAENWVAAVNSFGPIVNRGGGPYASLTQGKYDLDDTFQLQQFDSALPPNGNWKALGEYQNLSE